MAESKLNEKFRQWMKVFTKSTTRYSIAGLVCPNCKRYVAAIQKHDQNFAAYVHRFPGKETKYCLIPIAKGARDETNEKPKRKKAKRKLSKRKTELSFDR